MKSNLNLIPRRLKLENIDTKRNLLIIKQSKGRKDRITPLSPKILNLLTEYYKTYKPKLYMFEGQTGETMFDERSLQLALKSNLLNLFCPFCVSQCE